MDRGIAPPCRTRRLAGPLAGGRHAHRGCCIDIREGIQSVDIPIAKRGSPDAASANENGLRAPAFVAFARNASRDRHL